ncbi:periplasmic heavy metal sensor [Luteolibacter pohnpeiensis]|uniref:Periplasmic heavy metal sensor n=1 Tax=Luteolibacter pohnpeiensis TaxID=454153 RepID=A0A934VXI4_9BACT|nr:periplasmic heavy metal sensor [Luteolibacter pohnpeiensis]MBK1883883.1 periplasmic heavy metal sensor [Luteolibacter pohnpeiensis]
MNLKSYLCLPVLCSTFALSAPLASARPFSQFNGPIAQEFMKIRDDLNLTQSQRSQVREVLLSHKDELKAQRAAAQDARSKMKSATETYGADSKEADTAADGIASVAKSRALLVASIFSEIRPILTPEQIKTLEDARASFLSKGL